MCSTTPPSWGAQRTVLTASFRLQGQEFLGLNGGPAFTFSEAVSLTVSCENQEEVDRYWDALLAGGEPSQCGWLTDRYGLSWQIVPVALMEMMAADDAAAVRRTTEAMFTMRKLDVAALQRAYDG